ncbi:hypothetical protein FOA52_015107 [Chlamydomonas sp. UWO 241]|nr:hypothetical protein FOA52_015107 [Chlamydomonas sp. UWO 241]
MSKLGQNFNSAGIGLFLQILGGNNSLAVPHVSVTDIRTVNWPALKEAGFKGVIFDKDNTLTRPFALEVEPSLVSSLALCRDTFGTSIALYSNSAGLAQYDPDGKEAEHLESLLSIPVLRHTDKKPAGGPADLEAHFGFAACELVMVGDRYLTDVVFGNRLGMLTVRAAPFARDGEPAGVLAARAIEEFFVARWLCAGVQPPAHPLLAQADVGGGESGGSAGSGGDNQSLTRRFTLPLSKPWTHDS